MVTEVMWPPTYLSFLGPYCNSDSLSTNFSTKWCPKDSVSLVAEHDYNFTFGFMLVITRVHYGLQKPNKNTFWGAPPCIFDGVVHQLLYGSQLSSLHMGLRVAVSKLRNQGTTAPSRKAIWARLRHRSSAELCWGGW